ncbi:MAG: DUF1553 domain-containing protein, partial [Planctomycetota bacterium]
LAASGLLVRKTGGPSVRPYQPAGLWIEKSNFSKNLLEYTAGTGDELYRRSLYTFVRRTSPPPSMNVFDAPNRSVCTVKRESTNTPLQPLVLMNDPQFVESARVLAAQVSRAESEADRRLRDVYLSLTNQEASDDEFATLQSLYEASLARFENVPEAADKLLQVGEHPFKAESSEESAKVAALTIVANTLMNYDAFYMQR